MVTTKQKFPVDTQKLNQTYYYKKINNSLKRGVQDGSKIRFLNPPPPMDITNLQLDMKIKWTEQITKEPQWTG